MNPGYVYILANASLQSDFLKIGRTNNDPSERAADISRATGVPTPYEVVYYEAVTDCVRAESLIHQHLAECRVNDRREFFRIDLPTAQEIVQDICRQVRTEHAPCDECITKAQLSAAEDQLNIKDAEIRELNTRVISEIRKRKRMTRRYVNLRNRTRRNLLGKSIHYVIQIYSHLGRIGVIVCSTIRTRYVHMIPEAGERSIITWALIAPVGVGLWITLLIFWRSLALVALLTMILIATATIILEAQRPPEP